MVIKLYIQDIMLNNFIIGHVKFGYLNIQTTYLYLKLLVCIVDYVVDYITLRAQMERILDYNIFNTRLLKMF